MMQWKRSSWQWFILIRWELSKYMKYTMYVCVGNIKSLIASTNTFSDLQTLIDELERFDTKWEVKEYGVVVLADN